VQIREGVPLWDRRPGQKSQTLLKSSRAKQQICSSLN